MKHSSSLLLARRTQSKVVAATVALLNWRGRERIPFAPRASAIWAEFLKRPSSTDCPFASESGWDMNAPGSATTAKHSCWASQVPVESVAASMAHGRDVLGQVDLRTSGATSNPSAGLDISRRIRDWLVWKIRPVDVNACPESLCIVDSDLVHRALFHVVPFNHALRRFAMKIEAPADRPADRETVHRTVLHAG